MLVAKAAALGGAHRRPHGGRLRRQIPRRLREQQEADSAREPAELLGASRRVTQAHERVLRDRVIENMQRHASLYTRRWAGCKWPGRRKLTSDRIAACYESGFAGGDADHGDRGWGRGAGRSGAAALAIHRGATIRRQQPKRVSLIVTNGIVVTVDGERRVLNPGAVAIDGSDIVGVDTPDAIRSSSARRRRSMRAGRSSCPG